VVYDLMQDAQGRLHLLTAGPDPNHLLAYLTNATGTWTRQNLPTPMECDDVDVCPLPVDPGYWTDPGHLAVDPVTGRTVVAYGVPGENQSRITIASTPSGSPRFDRFYTGLVFPQDYEEPREFLALAPSAVTTFDGRITVALYGATHEDVADYRGVYVISGTGPAHVGHLTAVPGGDTGLLVTAVARDRVLLAYSRSAHSHYQGGRGWYDRGVYLLHRSYSSTTARWSFTAPQRRTTTPYDAATVLATDRLGHAYLTYSVG
jgi:hypothetical protein